MAVRIVTRRGERRLIVDIQYHDRNGRRARYRKDAEVQNLQAARVEERRRLASIATLGHPHGVLTPNGKSFVVDEPEPEDEADAAPLFSKVAEEYMRDYAMSRLKPSTRVGYTQKLKFLLNKIGDLPISKITPSKVRELDAELVKSGVKPSTRRGHQIVLRSIVGLFAVERGYLSEAPPFPTLPRCGKQIHTALTPEEVERLLKATSVPQQRRAFLLAAYAGLRAGEIRALRWKDVDFKARTLTVRLSRCKGFLSTPKSGHERLIPLAETLRAELSTELELRLSKKEAAKRKEEAKKKKGTKAERDPEGLVSTTSRGKAWGEWGLLQTFKRAAKEAGLDASWRFHDLRHFFVTSLFRAGAPAPAVQALAGHASLATTQRYAHTTQGDLTAAMARLEVTVRKQPLKATRGATRAAA